MIERVARAICRAQFRPEEEWKMMTPEARAAIEAMRELDDFVAYLGNPNSAGNLLDDTAAKYRREIHSRVIDAALQEK